MLAYREFNQDHQARSYTGPRIWYFSIPEKVTGPKIYYNINRIVRKNFMGNSFIGKTHIKVEYLEYIDILG